MSWWLASLIAETDKPRQADRAMPAVIAPDFGVAALLIPRRTPDSGSGELNVDHDAERMRRNNCEN